MNATVRRDTPLLGDTVNCTVGLTTVTAGPEPAGDKPAEAKIRELVKSTEGSLALIAQMHRGSLPEHTFKAAVAVVLVLGFLAIGAIGVGFARGQKDDAAEQPGCRRDS